MTPFTLPPDSTKTSALKSLSQWLLVELTAINTKFGRMASSGAKGEAQAEQSNAIAAAHVAALHEAVESDDATFAKHVEKHKSIPPAPVVPESYPPIGGTANPNIGSPAIASGLPSLTMQPLETPPPVEPVPVDLALDKAPEQPWRPDVADPYASSSSSSSSSSL